MSEEKKDTTTTTTNKSKKRSFEFFSEDTSYMPKIERTTTTPSVHPHEHYEDFSINPPIPVFNYIIDNKTLEIIEDKTGQP